MEVISPLFNPVFQTLLLLLIGLLATKTKILTKIRGERMDSSGSSSRTSYQHRCTSTESLQSVSSCTIGRWRVESSQPALPRRAPVGGCRGTRRHAGTHFPRAAQSKPLSHLRGCQLSRPAPRVQPPPHSPTAPPSR